MLLRQLNSLFGSSELSSGYRGECSSGIEEKEHIVIVPEKFKGDVERLQSYCGVELKSGFCIEIELSELLEILPRERRRKDTYDFIM